jgi:cyclopropane-fatty-acyl-phospholipid synthase
MPLAPPDRRAAAAAGLLRRVFASLEAPLIFHLWDGTTARVGARGESGFAVVFRSRRAFRRIVLRPTSLRFGEAYIDGEIDIEGDLFAAMRTANAIENLRVPLGTRLAVLGGLLRV